MSLKGLGDSIKGRATNAALGAVNKSISNKLNSLLGNKLTGKSKSSPLGKLYKSKNYEDLVFPLDLDDEHFMIIKVMERKRANAFSKGELSIVRNIAFPIPSNLTSSYAAQYQNEKLGLTGAAAAGDIGGADLGAGLSSIGSLIAQGASVAGSAAKNLDTDAAVGAAGAAAPLIAGGGGAVAGGPIVAALAGGSLTEGVGAGISKRLGLAVNPHMAVVFQGIDFRSHNFEYKFIAKSQAESIALQQIIDGFKYHMLPSYSAGKLAFQYPDEFEIEFSELHRPWLYDIGTCVLRGFNVNYNGEGTPIFFEQTGAPVSVSISLDFQETKLQTRDNFDKGSLRK